MNILRFIPQFFYSPDDGPGLGDVGDFGQDMAVLNDEPTPETPPKEKTESQIEAEDIDKDITILEDETPPAEGEEDERVAKGEDEEQEDEEEEETEGKETEELGPGKPRVSVIKKEFPGIFKRFPDLKSSLFRDAEFSKAFADPEEAHLAAQKAENYDQLEGSLVSGDPELLMKELHENNPRAFERVVENWLPKLRALDEKSYIAATEPILEELIYHAYRHGEKVGDKNLVMSARHIANFVFANGGEIPDIAKKAPQGPSPAEVQLQQERQVWAQTRFKEADAEIFQRVTKSLDQTIRQGLDPTGTMSERMKASIVADVINEMNKVLVNDQGQLKRMNGLWRRASQDSFSRQSKESIVNTYLSGARPLIRDLRNRIRAEYLGQGAKKRDVPDEKLSPQPQKKRSFEGSSRRVDVRRERATVLDPKKIDYSRTTDADILSGKVTLKGR